MQIAFYLLVGVIGLSPALFFAGGPIADGILIAYTAVTVAAIGFSIHPGEAAYLTKVIRLALGFAGILASWMLVQILPMPLSNIANPIWASAQAALNVGVVPSISMDRGATLLALVIFCFAAGIFFVASAVTIDRTRAELTLLWLAGITTLAAVALVAREIGTFRFIEESVAPTASLAALAALGVIVNGAAAVRAIERYETRRTSSDLPFAKFLRSLVIWFVAMIICLSAIIAYTDKPIIFATMSGLATFMIIVLVRRLGLDLWMNVIIVLMGAGIAAAFIVINAGPGDLTLRFAANSPQDLIQVAQSVLSDTRWMGNGAGTFGSLLSIYQNMDRSIISAYAPTSAATIAIELGRPVLWVILLMTAVLLMRLLSGALKRGRDSFYPTLGAGCVVLLTFEAFCDATLFDRTTIIVAATSLGLAFAQSVSRTNQTSLAQR